MATMLWLALTAAAADQTFEWDADVDVPVLVGAAGLYGTLYLVVEDSLRPSGQVSAPTGIDALVSPRFDPGDGLVSDLFLYGSMAGALTVATIDGVRDGGGAGTRFGIVTQTLLINGALTDTLKLAVRRPRPYTQLDATGNAELQEELADVDSEMSWPSGHSSFVSAAAWSAARIWSLSDAPRWQQATAYGVAGALSVTTAALRVTAGVHHPTDVIAGVALGASVGWLVPTLHLRSRREVAVAAGRRSLQVSARF